jgi:hypothetical protein
MIKLIILLTVLTPSFAQCKQSIDCNRIANAIYIAEGGSATRHPYGILQHYKHTTARQACINTIQHAYKDWNGSGCFISFLGVRYCPIGAKNDPTGLNKNWIRNVKWNLRKGTINGKADNN